MPTAYLALGSNLGDRAATLAAACAGLAAAPGVSELRASPVYATAPEGVTDQPEFLNQACALTTTLTPLALLELCQALENHHGRVRTQRWGPRTLDVDLLLYDDLELDDPHLTLPHPRLLQRVFVLRPLCDLAPDLVLADLSLQTHLARLEAALQGATGSDVSVSRT